MPVAIDEAAWWKPSQFVVALDIGTAHSSVSYAHLQQNLKPFNERVTHWPSRVGLGGSSDAKTASMLYYDSSNQVKASGAAVATPASRLAARLPEGLSVEKVYADMIKYMLDHTCDFFNQRNSSVSWERLAPTMTLVIAHPNGWGLREQDRLRQAVVLSGAMDEFDAQRRVYFVPEAEAAVHYVLWEKSQGLQPGDEFIVCDAGGSTVDTTAYRALHDFETTPELNHNALPLKKESVLSRLFRNSNSTQRMERNQRQSMVFPETPVTKPPIRLKELKASDCQPAGGVLVNEAFVAWLKEQFVALPAEHAYNLDLCVQKAEESFEANCKREFRTSADAPSEYVVEMSLGIPELGYPDGNIILQPDVVRGFFDDAYIFLVGGFGASQYLRQRVINEFQCEGRQVMFLDDAHGKAASDGSIMWFVRQGVVGRAARMSFGLQIVQEYNPAIPGHSTRTQVMLPSGRYHVKGKWDLIVEKDSVVDERFALRRSYVRTYNESHPDLGQFLVELFAWTSNTRPAPDWVTDSNDNIIDGFSVVCEIMADLSGMHGSLTKCNGVQGVYYKLQFELCLEFGGVELKAYLEWNEKKITRRSDAQIIVSDSPTSSRN